MIILLSKWWKYLNYSFYVFGTYASNQADSEQDQGSFCDPKPINLNTNILEKIWFFLLLTFVNVIDVMCS